MLLSAFFHQLAVDLVVEMGQSRSRELTQDLSVVRVKVVRALAERS